MTQRTGMSLGVTLLALLCAASFGAIVRVAAAGDNYHNAAACSAAWHGFVAGGSATDGSFFSRVEPGCGSDSRSCSVLAFGAPVGGLQVYDTTSTCNAWSRTWGNFVECTSGARVWSANGAVATHDHAAGAAGC